MKKIIHILSVFAAFVIVTGLASCNGGGLAITSTVPVDGQVDVAVDTVVSATFDKEVDPATINNTTFVVESSGGTAVAGTVSYDAATMTATFTLTDPLNEGTNYVATITTGAESTGGDTLSADYEWSFTTTAPAGSWVQVGGQVSPPDAESEDPVMMITHATSDQRVKADGSIVSVPSVGYRHKSLMMNLNFWENGSWGDSVEDPSLDRTHPTYGTRGFCTDGDYIYTSYSRNGAALQVDQIDFYNRIFAERMMPTSGIWEKMNGGNEISMPYPNDSNAWEAAIDCLPNGRVPVMVAWVEGVNTPEPDDAYVAEVNISSSSSSPALNRNDQAGDYFTRVRTLGMMAYQDDETYVALWEDHHMEQDRSDLFVSMYDGTSWTDLGAELASDYNQNTLNVASMAKWGDDLYIAYAATELPSDERQVYVKMWDGVDWTIVGGGPVTAFDAADHFDSSNPDLLFIDGVLYISWAESSQIDGGYIFVAHWDNALGEWVIDGDRLNVEQAHETDSPSLAYDSAEGYIYIAFEEYVDGYPQIFVKRLKHDIIVQ